MISKNLHKKQIVSLSDRKLALDLEKAIRLYASQRLQKLEDRFRQLDIDPGELEDIERQIAEKADGKLIQL